MTAPEALADWGRRSRRSVIDVAKLLGCKRAYVYMLLDGTRTPSLDLASKIERLTGIPASRWTETPTEAVKK